MPLSSLLICESAVLRNFDPMERITMKQQTRFETEISRRTVLAGASAIVAASVLPAHANLDWDKAHHGLSTFGDLKYPIGFRHFDYVNPVAPKGGTLSMQISSVGGNQSFNTFNSLNIFILKGEGAAGVGASFDSLMSSTSDEPDAMYGLVAERVQRTENRPEWRFKLRKEARFHDGSPLTAADIVFSLELMKTKAHPVYQQLLRDLVAAEAEAADVLRIELKPDPPRDLIMTIAAMPIFSKAYYSARNFDETTLEAPLGSGPYKVGRFEVGRFIEMERVPDYWARDLAVNVGQNNFDRLRYEYFRDRTVAFEGFKGRTFVMRQEFTSRNWATGYDFPAAKDGRVVREKISSSGATSIQGWHINMRREKFKDARIREAVILCFDFEWANTTLMFGSYKRTHSFFENTPMKASGMPSPAEIALLEPFRKDLPAEVFNEPFVPPVSDGSGQDRAILRRAGQLLQEAGCKRDGNVLKLPGGQAFTVELLDFDPSLHPHAGGLVKNLKLLGIDATLRTVDSVQYQKRMDDFDFDITMRNMGGTLTPGDALRNVYGSDGVNRKGSRNIAGINSPAADGLIEIIGRAKTREELNTACSALDRVLRATRSMIPAWHNDSAWLAYWDMFGKPEKAPRFAPTSSFTGVVASTWWIDQEKAKKLGL
jgi:microcin C transport system substrate-binding protein